MKWKIQSNKSEVIHSINFKGFLIEIHNFPGTRSIDVIIFNSLKKECFRKICDKKEWNIKDLKKECFLIVDNFNTIQ